MQQPRLLVTRRLPAAVEARASQDYDALLNEADQLYGADDLVRLASDVDAILTCSTERWTAGVVERLPARVRMIASFSVGYEHIDLAACRARGIVATNTPDVLTEATADIAMLCLLGAARRAYEGGTFLREGRWNRVNMTDLLGLELRGKVLGIVGMGRIGQAMARRARGFGLQVHYHNRRPLPPEEAHGAVYHASLDELLPLSAFLSLHCPGGEATHHLINAAHAGAVAAGRGTGQHGPGNARRRRGVARRLAHGPAVRRRSRRLCGRAGPESGLPALFPTASCCPISAVPRSRRAMAWAFARWTIWMRSSPADRRRTR